MNTHWILEVLIREKEIGKREKKREVGEGWGEGKQKEEDRNNKYSKRRKRPEEGAMQRPLKCGHSTFSGSIKIELLFFFFFFPADPSFRLSFSRL
jgi:hypothetical protein